MKKLFLLLTLLCILFSAQAQLKISTYGNVGIGTTTPQYKFDLNIGTVDTFRIHTWTNTYIDQSGAYGSLCFRPEMDYYLQLGTSQKKVGQIWAFEIRGLWEIEYSDFRMKENIRPIENALQRIRQVNGVQYTMKSENFEEIPEEKREEFTHNEYGVIAQDLQRIFPELVVPDEDGNYGVKYTRLIPIMVEAIKEQQNMIDSLQQKLIEERSLLMESIHELQNEISLQQEMPNNNFNTMPQGAGDMLRVFQNSPNPFTEATTIHCYVPEDFQNVQLCVYDMQGVRQKCIPVSGRQHTEVQISAEELPAGIYSYLLMGNGQLSDAKLMILTK